MVDTECQRCNNQSILDIQTYQNAYPKHTKILGPCGLSNLANPWGKKETATCSVVSLNEILPMGRLPK
jgi:hypothetical protein